jgi:hypothetical protein
MCIRVKILFIKMKKDLGGPVVVSVHLTHQEVINTKRAHSKHARSPRLMLQMLMHRHHMYLYKQVHSSIRSVSNMHLSTYHLLS